MEDKIVEIARFYEPEAAQMIESLLKSEGVNCYLRNEYTSRIQYPANVGGIRIELLESEVPPCKGDSGSKRIRISERRRRGRAAPSRFRLGTPRSVPPTSAPRKTDHRSFYPCSRIPGLGHLLRLACFIQLNNCKLWHAERLQIVKPYVSLFCGVSFAT